MDLFGILAYCLSHVPLMVTADYSVQTQCSICTPQQININGATLFTDSTNCALTEMAVLLKSNNQKFFHGIVCLSRLDVSHSVRQTGRQLVAKY
jgi:hypothetical protein